MTRSKRLILVGSLIGLSLVGIWVAWERSGPSGPTLSEAHRISAEVRKRRHLRVASDGEKLAYQYYSVELGTYVIEILNLLDGRIEREIINAYCPVWLGDESFAYISGFPSRTPPVLHVEHGGTTSEVELRAVSGQGSSFQLFSMPDSDIICLRSWEGSPVAHLIETGLLGTGLNTVKGIDVYSVSADGTRILANAKVYPAVKFVILDSQLRELDPLPLVTKQWTRWDNGSLAISPDGTRIVMGQHSDTQRSRLLRELGGPTTLHGSGTVDETRRKIRLFAYQSAQLRIWLFDLQHRRQQLLAEFPGARCEAIWMPNGNAVIVQADGELWRIPVPRRSTSPR